MTSVRDRINAGEFKPKTPYPIRPKAPAILSTPVGKLSADVLATIPTIRAEHEAAEAAYTEGRKTYVAEDTAGWVAFKQALEEEHDMAGHPKAALLYGKAYDRGHSGGMSEVANEYDDLVDLVK